MSKAADLHYISQPALGKQIKKLEAELKLKLFRRTNEGVVLTEAGKILYNALLDIQKDFSLAIESARTFEQTELKTFKIGVTDGWDISWFLKDLKNECQKQYKTIQIQIDTDSMMGSLLASLRDRRFDALLLPYVPQMYMDNIQTQYLTSFQYYIFYSINNSRYLKQDLSIRDFADASFLVPIQSDFSYSLEILNHNLQGMTMVPKIIPKANMSSVVLGTLSDEGVTFGSPLSQLYYHPAIEKIPIPGKVQKLYFAYRIEEDCTLQEELGKTLLSLFSDNRYPLLIQS